MTPEEIRLVQRSFAQMEPGATQITARFYHHLFARDPTTRALFSEDIDEQGLKFLQMLAVAVKNLDWMEGMRPAMEQLGRRHVRYRVQPEHYATFGTALLAALEEGLGADWTPELAAAWRKAYDLLTQTMRAAAAEADEG